MFVEVVVNMLCTKWWLSVCYVPSDGCQYVMYQVGCLVHNIPTCIFTCICSI